MSEDMSDSEAQEIYDKLAEDSMDDMMLSLAPGTTVMYPDGSFAYRDDEDWGYIPADGPVDPADLELIQDQPVINGTEQAFRDLLGG